MRIRVGHSPDPDDAFMYWALTTDLVDTRGHVFEQVLGDKGRLALEQAGFGLP